jgi:hypothetical protein
MIAIANVISIKTNLIKIIKFNFSKTYFAIKLLIVIIDWSAVSFIVAWN